MTKDKKATSYEEAVEYLNSFPPSAVADLSIRDLRQELGGEGSLGTYQKYKERYEREKASQPGLVGLIVAMRQRHEAHSALTLSLFAELEQEAWRSASGDKAAGQTDHCDLVEIGWGPVIPAEEVGFGNAAGPRVTADWPDTEFYATYEEVLVHDEQMAKIVMNSITRFMDDEVPRSDDEGTRRSQPVDKCRVAVGDDTPTPAAQTVATDTTSTGGENAFGERQTTEGVDPREALSGGGGSVSHPTAEEASAPDDSLLGQQAPQRNSDAAAQVPNAFATPAEAPTQISTSGNEPSPSRPQGAGSIEASTTPRPNAGDPHEGDPAPAGQTRDL